MSNRFLNGRRLVVEYFNTGMELANFVNRFEIESDDIQKIEQVNGIKWVLFYWG